jgi:hypothetical protein
MTKTKPTPNPARIWTSLALASFIGACGGGGGGAALDVQPKDEPAQAVAPGSMILKSLVIPDPKDYYKAQCDNPSIQFVIPVRINSDQLTDFIVHYWCGQAQSFGREDTTPTPDALVALTSQADGSYKVANEEVFGSQLYKLGGASRKYVRGDINGDGRDDFAFAMNWEDGRSGTQPITNATESSVLLSTPDGGYRVTRLGTPNWNHAVDIVRHANSVDVVFAGFVTPVQAFRYTSGGFTDVSTAYIAAAGAKWDASFRAIHHPVTGITQHIAGVAVRQTPGSTGWSVGEWGIQLLAQVQNGWTVLSEFWRQVAFTVGWTSWQNTPGGTNSVIEVDGRQYFGGGFDEMCVMPPLQAGGPRVLIAKMGAARDAQDRRLVAGGNYTELEALPVQFYNFFELGNNSFKAVPSPIVDEEIRSNVNFFDCKDINNDGLPDLVSYAFTRPGFNERTADKGKPTIYLNNGQGKLVRADISKLPGHTAGNELQSLMTDVNNDGIIDLLLFGSTTHLGGGAIEVHLLRDNIQLPARP